MKTILCKVRCEKVRIVWTFDNEALIENWTPPQRWRTEPQEPSDSDRLKLACDMTMKSTVKVKEERKNQKATATFRIWRRASDQFSVERWLPIHCVSHDAPSGKSYNQRHCQFVGKWKLTYNPKVCVREAKIHISFVVKPSNCLTSICWAEMYTTQ